MKIIFNGLNGIHRKYGMWLCIECRNGIWFTITTDPCIVWEGKRRHWGIGIGDTFYIGWV